MKGIVPKLLHFSEKVPLYSSIPFVRYWLSAGDCLYNKMEDYQNCSVLYCLLQSCAIICSHVGNFYI